MDKILPVLLIKNGQIVLGGMDNDKLINTSQGLLRTSEELTYFSLETSGPKISLTELSENPRSFEFIGNIKTSSERLLYIFVNKQNQNDVIMGEFYNGVQHISLSREIKKFSYCGYQGFGYSGNTSIIQNYLITYYGDSLYIFKNLELIYIWDRHLVSKYFVRAAIKEGIADGRVDDYLGVINKLVGLHKLGVKMIGQIARYDIAKILSSWRGRVDIKTLEPLLYSPELMERVISKINFKGDD